MTDPRTQNAPLVIELDDTAPGPDTAPPVPEPGAGDAAMTRLVTGAPRRGGAGAVLVWAGGALLSLILGVAVVDFITALLTRNPALATLAAALSALVLLAALVLAWREWRAWRRLGQVEALRTRAEHARATADLTAAKSAITEVRRLYAGRDDMAWALTRHAERAEGVIDADAALSLAETDLMAAPDATARREIEAAARAVAAATALIPLALADVAVALISNLRMIRRIAEIYGGRAGSFGSLRLMRRVFAHLLATGAVAVGDDLISSVAGGGLVSKLSRRFGEGVVNGALTARVGVAAMEVCRPLPFHSLPRPRVTALISRALTGLFGRDADPLDPPAPPR